MAATPTTAARSCLFTQFCEEEYTELAGHWPPFWWWHESIAHEFWALWRSVTTVKLAGPLTEDKIRIFARDWAVHLRHAGQMMTKGVRKTDHLDCWYCADVGTGHRVFVCSECGYDASETCLVLRHIICEHPCSPAVKSAAKRD